ncbi:MAG: mechanosensitive ion channel [Mesosutterella sp.]|nr:mechanosensitive ion channel [Mesosutterella sp.]
MNLEASLFSPRAVDLIVGYSEKIILAIVVLIVGKFIISAILNGIGRQRISRSLDSTARQYLMSFVQILLWVVLLIAVIQILGVPMASVITVLASCGLAIGLALQGALSNIAGGVMLMAFRPFNAGDYVAVAGSEGTVQSISLFYTTLVTVDNKRLVVPNSQIMNATITNFSSEKLRRVDLDFGVAKSEKPAEIQTIILDAIQGTKKVLSDPAPFARLSGGNDKQMTFTARAWCNSADYWDVYFDLNQNITEALGNKGIKAPAVRMIQD